MALAAKTPSSFDYIVEQNIVISIVPSYVRTKKIKSKSPGLTYFTTHYSFDLLVHKMEV